MVMIKIQLWRITSIHSSVYIYIYIYASKDPHSSNLMLYTPKSHIPSHQACACSTRASIPENAFEKPTFTVKRARERERERERGREGEREGGGESERDNVKNGTERGKMIAAIRV